MALPEKKEYDDLAVGESQSLGLVCQSETQGLIAAKSHERGGAHVVWESQN